MSKHYSWIVIDKWNWRLTSRKHKLKSQWDITSYPLEWLKLDRLVISNVDEDIKQMQLSYNAGGSTSTLKKAMGFKKK